MVALPRTVRALLIASVLAASSVAAIGGAPVTRAATPAADPGSGAITVLTFNMCGEHCNADSTGADITDLLTRINAYQPNAVLLQEVCGAQFKALQTLSQAPGNWALSGVHDVTEKNGCENGDSFGDAVLVHGVYVAVAREALRYPHGEGKNHQVRKVLCVQSKNAFPRWAEVCTVHAGLGYEIGNAHQAVQVKDAYNFARGQSPTIPLIFGGDLNVTPNANALDPIYHKGGGGADGAMEEVDACPGKHGRAHRTTACNRRTHDAYKQVKHRTKNDYIFGSRKSFKDESATVVASKYSDHDLLIGHLFMCSSGIC